MRQNFLEEIKGEYKKVSWPNKQEVVNATLLVAALSVVLSIYLGLFDLLFSKFLDLVVAFFGG
jgi:preprotein translocase subunit SecE